MERIQAVTHAGKQIIIMDISGLSTAEEIRPVLDAAHAEVAKTGNSSARLLSKVESARYNNETTTLAKEFVRKNTPYMKASAMVGVKGIHMVLFNVLLKVAGRDIKLFDSEAEAMDWLAAAA